ncbi:unnamed protein product [Heligmosomoides polygyrus]|uniref:Transmembrane protein n=1 Tax=Heligmosomoides polygyrus TaxID=6339 RepID=A0A183FZZ8_HELPZ|nr:unnamed protein product [Heligmosomoides polygyrus]
MSECSETAPHVNERRSRWGIRIRVEHDASESHVVHQGNEQRRRRVPKRVKRSKSVRRTPTLRSKAPRVDSRLSIDWPLWPVVNLPAAVVCLMLSWNGWSLPAGTQLPAFLTGPALHHHRSRMPEGHFS